jgi:hypothetical protein
LIATLGRLLVRCYGAPAFHIEDNPADLRRLRGSASQKIQLEQLTRSVPNGYRNNAIAEIDAINAPIARIIERESSTSHPLRSLVSPIELEGS